MYIIFFYSVFASFYFVCLNYIILQSYKFRSLRNHPYLLKYRFEIQRNIKIDQCFLIRCSQEQNKNMVNSVNGSFCHNKIINNKTVSMIKQNESTNTRKKLQDYSYCLSHNIGKGYSSSVYRGRNDLTDETVAIKVIDMRMLKGEVHKSLLASQIQVLKTFKNSRNIIEVYDIYTTKNNTYIITQLCEGGDLSKLISSKRGMAEKQAITYLRQIADGYNQISANRIIHRDLKPANILLKNNKIKIADFGFAMKSSESKKYSSYNVGSPIYMPPQALNDNKYSFKSDVWAIGVIYFELLTGRTPWKAKTEKELGKQLLSVPITKLLPQNLSLTSVEFLEKTLCVNYDKRMSPQELQGFMHKFDSICSDNGHGHGHGKTAHSFLTSSTGITGTQCSIRGANDDDQIPSAGNAGRRHQTSLNKNTINTPKNMRRFTFLKGTNNSISNNLGAQHLEQYQNKQCRNNASLPKTASTINNRTLAQTQNLGLGLTQTQTQAQTHTNITDCSLESNRKQISKQLLAQVHFCRFVYKLVQRIQSKIEGDISNNLKSSMCGIVFDKLDKIMDLSILETSVGVAGGRASSQCIQEYHKSSDFKKICQIVTQYQEKYEKDLRGYERKWQGFDVFQNQLSTEIKQIFSCIKGEQELEEVSVQQKVIILDYLITLRQLSSLLAKNDLEMFHTKSKIEAIVEGAPAKVITEEHMRAITAKLKAIKLI